MLEGGEGHPIVLLHGQGEFGATWGRVIPDLTRTHRVLAPDLPGHGASDDLARIAVPTTLIWGREDLQVRLRIAKRASAHYGWPLHVIEDTRDDPAVEQPQAFLDALGSVLVDR